MKYALLLLALVFSATASAHGEDAGEHTNDRPDGPVLHEGYAYDNCYIDLHPELTQEGFRQFNAEFGSGYAFTPFSGPGPLGAGHVQFGLALRKVSVDDSEPAWNDSWTHPGHDHWLGPVDLPILQARVGLSERTDVEAMFSLGMANWVIAGLGVRHQVLPAEERFDLAVRGSVQVAHAAGVWTLVSTGGDLTLGKRVELGTRHLTATPYAGLGLNSAVGTESDADVDLAPVVTFSPRATAGLELGIGPARIGVEGTLADIRQLGLVVGAAF